MGLFTINADLKPLVSVLTRIADALDRQYPVVTLSGRGKMITEEDLHVVEDESLWKKEIEEEQEVGIGGDDET